MPDERLAALIHAVRSGDGTYSVAQNEEINAALRELQRLRTTLSAIKAAAATDSEGDALVLRVRQLRMMANGQGERSF